MDCSAVGFFGEGLAAADGCGSTDHERVELVAELERVKGAVAADTRHPHAAAVARGGRLS